ncbi:MAG: hypothetical protein HC847_21345 [Hydrococcus sp. RU_2_2]|jgi:hypothetical protein|nr:hypothetical protein [Hydrococcus sp. RU_2_2]NJP21041.1 hypothetical protein [Hydrococcus sp. CRU_1_1]NJQ98039.1 hypothetical protein [Hydrococcus sp. CSU_1_8]
MDSKPQQETKKTYICYAPPPSDASIIPSIYCIEVEEDIEVEWLWTTFSDGNRVVTGYQLIQKQSISETEIDDL